jgi:hypothetical protein
LFYNLTGVLSQVFLGQSRPDYDPDTAAVQGSFQVGYTRLIGNRIAGEGNMCRFRLLRVCLVFALACLALVLLWASLPPGSKAEMLSVTGSSAGTDSTVQPSSAVIPLPPPGPASPPVDPRWLDLVRATSLETDTRQPSASLSLDLNIIDRYVAGFAPSALPVDILVKRGVDLVATAMVDPVLDPAGFFFLSSLQWDYGYYGFETGDVVWVTQSSQVISLTVPVLDGLADAQADLVYGQAPAEALINLALYPFDDPDHSYTTSVYADNSGRYQASWASIADLQPRDDGYIAFVQDDRHQAFTRFVAPFLRVQVDSPYFYGTAAPDNLVTITVTDRSGAIVGIIPSYTDDHGLIDGYYICDWPCYHITFSPGYTLIASAAGQTFSMTVLSITAHADLVAGQVSGNTSPGQSVEIFRFPGPLSTYDDLWSTQPVEQVTVASDASGGYTAALSLSTPNYGIALVTSQQGYQTYTRYAVPYLQVSLGKSVEEASSNVLWGQVNDLNTVITLSVQGPSGYLKDWFRMNTTYSGYFNMNFFYYLSNSLRFETGDYLSLMLPDQSVLTLTLPSLTASADPEANVVSGFAPPEAVVTVSLSEWYYPPGREGGYPIEYIVTSTASLAGEYLMDFSDLVDFSENAYGDVSLTTSLGYRIIRTFSAYQVCPPSLWSAQVNGNTVNFRVPWYDYNPECPTTYFRLRDPLGQLKAERLIYGWQDAWFVNDAYLTLYQENSNKPIPILPGDSLEVDAGGDVNVTTVPPLSAVLTPGSNQVNGQASPGEVVILEYDRGSGYLDTSITVTANTQGEFSTSLPGIAPFTAGTRIRVQVGDQPQFYTLAGLPLIQATLNSAMIEGWLPPITPYTLTLLSPQPAITTHGYADPDTGDYRVYFYILPFLNNVTALESGDQLLLEIPGKTLQLTLPYLTAHLDIQKNTLSGQAPPGSRLQVDLTLKEPVYYPSITQMITATSSGTYSVTFPGVDPNTIDLGTLTSFDEEGQQTILKFAPPHWSINLDSTSITGVAEAPGETITLTHLSATENTLEVITATTSTYDGIYSGFFQQLISPGDTLYVASRAGMQSYLIPSLSAAYDYWHQVLEGQASPGWTIVVIFPYDMYGRTIIRHAIADASGHFGIDASDLDLPSYGSGYVEIMDEIGNTVQKYYQLTGYRLYLPIASDFP